MTIGVGGSLPEIELEKLSNMVEHVEPIALSEYVQRINKAQQLMKKADIAALYVNAGTNLYYFTGTQWHPSERLVGAIIPQQGEIQYLAPYFEMNTLKQHMRIEGDIHGWQEHQCPYQLFTDTLTQLNICEGNIAIDETTAFFITNGINAINNNLHLIDGKQITASCRWQKSTAELALLQQAKNMTLAVQKSTARILHTGISTEQVKEFINKAHRKVGANGSSFCIVLFGKDSAYPHGVKQPKALANNDIVLIDTGCQVEGYHSDITRSYVYGTASSKQRKMWKIEKMAQNAAFKAAQIGNTCADVDRAARDYLAEQGLGPEYQTPGCPHRTGHGIGLDIHEWPYLVMSDNTPLDAGMCFSNEPMLVIPEEFGIRLEDHFYMTKHGPKWFTEPSHSIDDPFGYHK